jgi:steroid 5-alpha reductase family enzyme
MNAWPLLVVWIGASLVMLAGWLHQRRTRNAGIVDVLWSACMAAAAVFYAACGSGAPLPRVLVAVLGGIWGARLAVHLWQRVSDEPEDGRYRYLRDHWQDDQQRFLLFFMAQALLTALFSLPFWIAAHNPNPQWNVWTASAVLVWLISLGGETIADRQLARFRANPEHRGQTCRNGLWRYSRHPNYFFEWLHWFAYVCLSVGTGTGWVAASLVGPVLMLISLYWITGIPFTEAQALRSRGDDYRAYQRTTSPLIPWFPRTSVASTRGSQQEHSA